ncbi:hypothetical protein, partial [Yersinia ruckeri]
LIMSSIEDDLTIIKEYFSRTQNESQKICARLGIVGKFFYIPIDERIRILDELLQPHSNKKSLT